MILQSSNKMGSVNAAVLLKGGMVTPSAESHICKLGIRGSDSGSLVLERPPLNYHTPQPLMGAAVSQCRKTQKCDIHSMKKLENLTGKDDCLTIKQ